MRVHVKNNHASPETFPPTPEGEAVFTITRERFEAAAARYPHVARHLDVFIDWDLDHFENSMRTAEVLVTWDLPTADLAEVAPNLRLIHIIGAGVEHLCPMDWVPPGVTVVNNRGAHADKAGEYGLMAVLMLHNRLPAIIGNQQRARWESLYSTPIGGKTLLVIGTGSIGAAAARRCRALGMHVVGVTRHGRPLDAVDEMHTPDRLDNLLPRADFVFVAVPLTPETRNLLDARRQALMKRGAGLVNVGRAATVDYDALAAHLRSGHLSGAVLDVFDPEPLPSGSPLWDMPNLVLTPHVSADDGDSYVPLTLELVFRNLERLLEGRPLVGAVADFDEGMGKFTIHANLSMYNYVGWLIAISLNVPAHRLNIVPVIAGGSFGSKLFAHKVPVLAATLARAAGQPVKFLEDRIDNITSCDNHGSDRVYDMEVAVMNDGTITSLRMKVIDDYGAYLQFGVGHHGNAAAQLTGPYRIGSGEIDLTAVLTNKCQQGAYRGFGSEVTNFVLERMVDAAADELGMDPADIRRKNFIQPDQFPYKIPTGNVYDSGDYDAVLDKALEMVDYQGWRKRQEEARREGRYIGIGLVTCQERSVFSSTEFWFWNDEPGFALTSSPESVNLKIDPTGKAFVTLHAPFWGNSPETVATQIVAEHLTMNPEDIHITYSDTDHGLNGTGPGGSRYTVMIAGAIAGASGQIKRKLMRIAAHMLEAAEVDLELVEGAVRVQGSDRSVSIAEIALQAHYFRLSLPDDVNSGLDASHIYDHPYTTQPSEDRTDLGVFYPIMGHMCHIPVIEVDVETGRIEFLDYVAVHDCGTVVNPMTLAGHVRGGTAQGIGSAVYEHFYYDDDGQLLAGTYADYLIPTLKEVPANIRVGHVETPSPFTEFGIKGGGEGGRMGAPPAIAAAVEDALRPLGIKVDGLPITPMRLRELIREAAADA